MGTATRTSLVWLVLMAATSCSWLLGTASFTGHQAAWIPALGIIAVAMIKVFLVMQEFMEVRAAPAWLRLASHGWIALIGTAMTALYLAG